MCRRILTLVIYRSFRHWQLKLSCTLVFHTFSRVIRKLVSSKAVEVTYSSLSRRKQINDNNNG